MPDDNKLHAGVTPPATPEDPNAVKGREIAERMVRGIGRWFRFVITTLIVAFPLALVGWWIWSFITTPTFLADLTYWQWYAVVVFVRFLWGDDRRR